jgi:hypothetical protein
MGEKYSLEVIALKRHILLLLFLQVLQAGNRRARPGVYDPNTILKPLQQTQGIIDPQGSTLYSNRSPTPQQAKENALAPGFSSQYPITCLFIIDRYFGFGMLVMVMVMFWTTGPELLARTQAYERPVFYILKQLQKKPL